LSRILRHAHGELALDHCLVMGIVNRTPDSFYDGGRMDLDAAVDHAGTLVEEGADLLDLGAVKAGPGDEVPEDEEMRRLLPLVEALSSDLPLSIETARPRVAEAAIDAGAAIVNDVSGLLDPGLVEVCGAAGAGLVLMHNGGQIRGRPRHPYYDDVVGSIERWWEHAAARALEAGVSRSSIVVDPGLDFGMTTFHSLEVMRRLEELTAGHYPVLVAPSNKDIVGETLGLGIDDRLEGTLALVALAVSAGASMVRVHEVGATVRTVAMVEAVEGGRPPKDPVRGLWD
jgi:dihydropteroate synthase